MKMCKFVQINSFRKDLSGSKQKDRKNDKNRGSRDVPQAAGLRCLRVARRAQTHLPRSRRVQILRAGALLLKQAIYVYTLEFK